MGEGVAWVRRNNTSALRHFRTWEGICLNMFSKETLFCTQFYPTGSDDPFSHWEEVRMRARTWLREGVEADVRRHTLAKDCMGAALSGSETVHSPASRSGNAAHALPNP